MEVLANLNINILLPIRKVTICPILQFAFLT